MSSDIGGVLGECFECASAPRCIKYCADDASVTSKNV